MFGNPHMSILFENSIKMCKRATRLPAPPLPLILFLSRRFQGRIDRFTICSKREICSALRDLSIFDLFESRLKITFLQVSLAEFVRTFDHLKLRRRRVFFLYYLKCHPGDFRMFDYLKWPPGEFRMFDYLKWRRRRDFFYTT